MSSSCDAGDAPGGDTDDDVEDDAPDDEDAAPEDGVIDAGVAVGRSAVPSLMVELVVWCFFLLVVGLVGVVRRIVYRVKFYV